MRARIYLVLFLLLVVVAGSAYACSEAMRVREVVVLGCEARDPADVVDLAAIANEESIFKLNFDEIRAKIDADPYFEVESIDYLFPDTLRIQVFERRASAAIRYQDSFLVVDETGFVLEVQPGLGDLDLPVVSSLNVVGGAAVGETVAASQESQMDALRAILTELHSQDVIQLVSEINLEAVSDLWMTTVSGFEVRLGNFEDMAEKIRWLRAVEPILVSEGYSGGVITVSTGENASYLAPEETPAPDGGTEPDAGGEPDAGATPDAGSEPDAGSSEPDAGATPDAGSEPESSAAPSDEPQQTPPPSEEPDAPEEAG